ncbi:MULTISPECIES: ABC transporter permease subunit [Gammaproteobacteria]|uniref:ABC transporter permease subunit n=1 Tax=Gammaproteobacteria TaxID=1236 RepID=UPI000DD04EE5|nr:MULTISPECIES: ABC transporter permease subunit [Gammaproteobacteria]RTE87134.1 ABC transporter permease subunit [Aliidiomarina sp. B3213]TCZ93078.1 ABC transporter permease subunit [Lysobacter sp. N42]
MLDKNLYYEVKNPSPLQLVWQDLRANPISTATLYILGALLIISIFGPLLAPYGSNEQFIDAVSLPPAWSDQGDMRFLLGTDALGRDMVSRLMHGARYTFGLPMLAVIIAALVGCSLGAISAVNVGVKSSTVKHLLDVLLSIPSLLLALVIIAVIGPGLSNAILAIALVFIPQFLHITKNAIADEQKQPYVLASRLNGVDNRYLFFSVLLPNIIKAIVMHLTIALSAAILDIAALGFLGLGAQAPAPEWGAMLAQSLEVAYNSPWVMALPGLALFVTLISVNILGESIRSALDKRLGS